MVDYSKAYKYMGVSKAKQNLDDLLRETEKEVIALSSPKMIAETFDVEVVDGYYHLKNTDIILKSEAINDLFYKVDKIAVLMVTLGMDIDRRVEYYAKTNPLKMMAFDALSSVYIEEIADEFSANLRGEYDGYQTVRFSCGYGDLPLDLQPEICTLLDSQKTVGVTVTSSNMMRPMKTISAFQGFSKYPQKEFFECAKCKAEKCGGSDCPRRKYEN